MAAEYGYDIPSKSTGECWAISAHENGDCEVSTGRYKGRRLSSLWNTERSLFGNIEGECFPLLVKIIDAKADLSIQVHPDDDYARQNENGSLGKTECWYVLDCKEDSEIVIGHNAESADEVREMVTKKQWKDFIRVIKLKKGDFFQINPGCLHAIKAGTMILETQQNSDITYRVYDYDRLDSSGSKRQLHIEKSLDVITAPYEERQEERCVRETTSYRMERLVACDYYIVWKLDVFGETEFPQTAPFLNVSIIEGEGSFDGIPVKKGMHFILPAEYGSYKVRGKLTCITSHV